MAGEGHNIHSMVKLYKIYKNIMKSKVSIKESIKYLKMVVELEDIFALFVGSNLYYGDMIEADYKEAARYF